MTILLPVSADPSYKDALSLAVEVAKAHGADIRILFVIDQGEVRRIEGGGGLSAIHMAQHAAEEFERRKMEEATESILAAVQVCAAAGVEAHGDIREGDPPVEILASAGGCELLVSSIASHFDPGLEDRPGQLVLSMMKEGGIPVLLACSPYRPIRTVVVGCGGKARSERAVGAMTKLSLWKSGVRGILLAVDDSPESGERRLSTPRNILADEGYPPWEKRVVPGHRQEAFSAFCKKENADVAVLGGWGERRWDDFAGLSITQHLLGEAYLNLFLYM
jgi:nucleotide-binding universal stress UspA family protein